ncbi:MAG: DNA primase [Armatimonadetes bacterium]|nr:DNA primase [Armatimonadota bacterium]
MASSSDAVQEIKQRLDLLEVISDYVKLRPAGRSHVGLCPFHSEKTGSFNVTPDKGIWYCFGCQEGGDVFKFLQKIENLSFPEALERLAKRAGVTLPEHPSGPSTSERDRLRALHELACRFYERTLSQTPAALQYLERRGIAPETAKAFRLGFAPDSWESLRTLLRRERASDDDLLNAGLLRRKAGETRGGYDAFRDRLLFPICDGEGRVIAFGGRILEDREGQPKYINSPETPIFSKKRVLYAYHRALPAIKERREALVMEGYMDVIAAHENGFPYAVAPLGTALTPEHLQLLKRHCDRALLVFDADGAGMRAALRSLALFEQAEMEARVVVLPQGEDPDSLLRKRGPAPFAQALEEARPLLDYRMESILSQHDVRSDEGFARAMREIAPFLSQVPSNNSWIHRLAEIRSAGAPERVAFWEEDVRRRVRGARSAAPSDSAPFGAAGTAPFGAAGEKGNNNPEAPTVSTAVLNLFKKEEMILRGCMEDRETAAELLAHVPPDRYLRSETRELATLILTRLAAEGTEEEWNPGAEALESETLGTLVARLAADPTPIPDREALIKIGNELSLHREKKQVKDLTEGREPSVDELEKIKQIYQKKQTGWN